MKLPHQGWLSLFLTDNFDLLIAFSSEEPHLQDKIHKIQALLSHIEITIGHGPSLPSDKR